MKGPLTTIIKDRFFRDEKKKMIPQKYQNFATPSAILDHQNYFRHNCCANAHIAKIPASEPE